MDYYCVSRVLTGAEFDQRYTSLNLFLERAISHSFRAHDTRLDRPVFLKILSPSAVDDPAATSLFLSEPLALQRLARRAPHVPVLPVLDFGRCADRPFFTLPLLTGWSLDPVVKTKCPFVPRAALQVVEACLRILDLLHNAGFAHGDVSPDNIFVETTSPVPADGTIPDAATIRLLDYNSVRDLEKVEPDLPPFFKPNYAAPEVARGRPASVAGDLYSLGMVFFQMLAGNVPYRAGDPCDAAQVIPARDIPPLPSPLGVPHLIEAFIRRLLSREPGERPGSAGECLRTLADLRDVHAWILKTEPPDAAWLGSSFVPVRLGRERNSVGVPLSVRGDQAVLPPKRPAADTVKGPFAAFSAPPPPPPAAAFGVDGGRATDAWFAAPPLPAVPPPAPAPAPSASDVPDELSRAHCVAVPGARPSADGFDFSVFAPSLVLAGRSFVLELWAYLRSDRHEMLERAGNARRIARDVAPGAVVVGGTELTVILRLDDFVVTENQQTFGWCRDIINVPFIVESPRTLTPGIFPGQISILHCGMLISRIVFDVRVGAVDENERPSGILDSIASERSATRIGVRENRVRSAFASYASSDRTEVLRRVQGIEAVGVRVFMDVLSLRAGQDWQRQIVEGIRQNDIFYLFWSPNASQSRWVEKEWRLALEERGIEYIHPIPLVDPSEAPPPTELASRHFNDLVLACLRSQAASMGAHAPR